MVTVEHTKFYIEQEVTRNTECGVSVGIIKDVRFNPDYKKPEYKVIFRGPLGVVHEYWIPEQHLKAEEKK